MSYIGNEPLSVAFLTDTFSGNGSTVAFTMSVAPANTSSVLVAVTGVVQDPSTYSVSGTTLTFSAAPPSGTSNISVRYLGIPASGVTTTAYRTVTDTTATAGQTTFTIPSYTVGYVDVFRNGVRLAAADFTATTGTTIVLVNPASAGDTITTVSFYVSSVLNAIPATAGSIGTSYLADASVTQAKLATGVAGTGPAFGASITGTNTLSSGTTTIVPFNSKTATAATNFDTNGCYNNTGSTTTLNGYTAPAYSFVPNVAGYYKIDAMVGIYNGNAGVAYLRLYVNGSAVINGQVLGFPASASEVSPVCSVLLYLNAGDYVQVYAVQSSGSTLTMDSSSWSYFFGSLVRKA
jgi:hypothetical protein